MQIAAYKQTWPLDKPFRISRGVLTEAHVIVATATDGNCVGRGESVPSARYDQTLDSVLKQIGSLESEQNMDRDRLQNLLPPGAARNAVDCALWDLEAKRSGKRVWELAGLTRVDEVPTSLTISLDTPKAMGASARNQGAPDLLKIKLGGDDLDLARVKAVHDAAPKARLLIDANESWSPEHYRELVPELSKLGVELIEQPFSAHLDAILQRLDHPVLICADESCHTTDDLARLKNCYDMINVKLDKTGGLTEAIRLVRNARASGFKIMTGCMVCTSLGIAPARLLASVRSE